MENLNELRKKTLEILAEKIADYGLGQMSDEVYSNGEVSDATATNENEIPADLQYQLINEIHNEETKNVEASVLDESSETACLRNYLRRMNELKERYAKCIESVNGLRENYETVTERTSSLHHACERMMAHQTQIAAGAEQIRSNLYYYTQSETIMKKLNSGMISVNGQAFTQLLSTINECLSYLRTHLYYKDSAAYIVKYEQCLSKAMTLIRLSVLADLEVSSNSVKERYAQLDTDNHQNGCADDETFALLYGLFAARSNSVLSALSLAEQYFRDVAEYQSMVSDCQQAYFAIRKQMLEPVITSTIEHLKKRHADSSCALTRNGCAFLLRLCDDEFRLYKQFFMIEAKDGNPPRSVTSSGPSSPVPSLFASFVSSSTSFDEYVETLCYIFYDILRPIIVHNPHLETLAELCTILKVEMIEERCGLMQSMISSSQFSELEDGAMNPRIGFIRVIGELVGDVVERIVYRASLYGQTDIVGFKPSKGDLAYPEKLQMMKEIEKEHSLKDDRNNRSTRNPTSAIDLHCLWYPTVRRTVLCLSKLFKCVEAAVFQSIARELLTLCCQSLYDAAEQIRNSSLGKYSRMRRSMDAELFVVKHLLILREQTSPYRSLATGNVASTESISQRDYSLDLSKYKASASHLLQDRHRWFELNSNNAFLEFLLQVPLAITESSGDCRRVIDMKLKTHCHNLINTAVDMIALEFIDFLAKAETLSLEPNFDISKVDSLKANHLQNYAAQAYKKLTHSWPEILSCFDLYIGVRDTEDILLQPVKKKISDAFLKASSFADKFYDDEQKQIAALPTQEHVWLIMNAKN